MDIKDIARSAEFDFETSAHGNVRISAMTSYDLDAAEEAAQSLTPPEVAKLLFVRMSRPTSIAYDDHLALKTPTAYFDGELLSADELELFSKQITTNYRYLAKLRKDQWLEQDAQESASSYLVRLLHHRAQERDARHAKMMRPLTSALFTDATRSSWAGSALANARLGATLEDMKSSRWQSAPPPLVSLPKTAAQTTNELLTLLGNRLDATAPIVEDMAAAIIALEETVRGMQADAIISADRADKKTRIANWTAIAGIFLTLAAVLLSLKQTTDDSLVAKLEQLRTETSINQAALILAVKSLAAGMSDPKEAAETPKAVTAGTSRSLSDLPRVEKAENVKADTNPVSKPLPPH